MLTLDQALALDDPEDEETELLAPRQVERTVPRYPTDGPGDGRSWNEYFRTLKADLRASNEPDEDEDGENEVVERGYDITPQEAGSAAKALAKRLSDQGWQVRVRVSVVRVPKTVYKSNSKEGAAKEYQKGDEKAPAHRLETFCLLGVKYAPSGDVGLAIDATWTRKEGGSMSFQGAKTFDVILGHEWRTTIRNARDYRDWEIEEGVTPTEGLDWWLNIVAPKPETAAQKKKRLAEAELVS